MGPVTFLKTATKLAALFAATACAAQTIHVDATPGHAINRFDPDAALGSSLDVLSRSGIDKVFTPHILNEALSAGWGPISYRNNSELRMAAWHWTENGTWSDVAHRSGYFTGSSELKEPLRYILSYALPHRGFSTSGDRPLQGPKLLYWKSNPYLTSKFTGESDAAHPQWVVMDLKSERPVSAVRIDWAEPFATEYRVEYWTGIGALDFDRGPQGTWHLFPKDAAPVSTRYLRVWMTASSNTCDEHGSADIRNCVGYAIRSIQVEPASAPGQPPPTYTSSSIDPWHAATGAITNGNAQHSGFDLFFTSGITNNLPALIPVTMLYGTPDDAAAQVAYLKKRGYPIAGIEMGEEPDGKRALPEDYGALYIQWARAIHKVDPALKLGGPVFEGVNEDIRVWPDAQGRTSWMGRFVAYLKEHGHLADLGFVSFEHYPYSRCNIKWEDLYREPRLMKHILEVWRQDGVPANVPLMVTESSLAAGLNGHMSTIFGALWLADSIGSFFEGGGAAYFHSPIQPQGTQNTCQGWGSWSNFESDADYNIKGYTSFYFAAHMINLEWAQHRSGVHEMFPTSGGNELISSYALRRPDGNWSLMFVNRDENNAHEVTVVFDDVTRKTSKPFANGVTLVTFGSDQYVWRDDGPASHADPDGPPAGHTVASGPFMLPKASLTVLRGKLAK